MSALVLLSIFGLSMMLPVFVSANSGDEDDPVEPPEPETQIEGTDGDDMLNAVLDETVNGLEGDDTLIATESSDGAVLNGGEGADSLSLAGMNGTGNGEAGDDTLEFSSREGSATLNGGTGQDLLYMDDGAGAGDGTSVANGGDGDDTITGIGLSGTVNGDGGDDEINVQGRLDGAFGGNGDDTIHGGALDSGGGTSLFGGAGNDVLSTSDDAGFDYRSELDGGAGNDTLTTELLGPAPDVLDVFTGGAGEDVFAATFNLSSPDPSAGADLGTLFEVADFDAADDALLVEIGNAGVFFAEIDATNRISFDINDLEDGSGALLEFTIENADASGPLTGAILLSGVTGLDPDTVDFGIQLVEFA